MARRLQRPRPLRQKATAPCPTGADVLQRTYALRFDRVTRARSGQAGARARRRAPAAMAGRGDAQSRMRRSGRVGGCPRDAEDTPARVPGPSWRSWWELTRPWSIMSPHAPTPENPNTISQKVNRHNQPQQNATGPSLATAAVPDHPGATPPLVPAPLSPARSLRPSRSSMSMRPREATERMHPLKTDRYSGVVHCGSRRPRESRLATAVRGRPSRARTPGAGRGARATGTRAAAQQERRIARRSRLARRTATVPGYCVRPRPAFWCPRVHFDLFPY